MIAPIAQNNLGVAPAHASPRATPSATQNGTSATPARAPEMLTEDRAVAEQEAVLNAAVERIARFVQPRATLEFSVDRSSERRVVKVVDAESGEVIRQFPSEEALKISQSLDRLQGLLLNRTA